MTQVNHNNPEDDGSYANDLFRKKFERMQAALDEGFGCDKAQDFANASRLRVQGRASRKNNFLG